MKSRLSTAIAHNGKMKITNHDSRDPPNMIDDGRSRRLVRTADDPCFTWVIPRRSHAFVPARVDDARRSGERDDPWRKSAGRAAQRRRRSRRCRTPPSRNARQGGRAARGDVRRSSHAEGEPSLDCPDPVELLEQQAADRIPDLVPIRYGRKLASPAVFYPRRGVSDGLGSRRSREPKIARAALRDAHVPNFGHYEPGHSDL
jgi:hypothetical protein